jgi:transposase
MALHLTPLERTLLERLLARADDPRVRRRGRALLDLAAGDRPAEVALRYRVARSTVYNWISRYQQLGVSEAALSDRPRPGRPRLARPQAGPGGGDGNGDG